jgi:hypothetical protein
MLHAARHCLLHVFCCTLRVARCVLHAARCPLPCSGVDEARKVHQRATSTFVKSKPEAHIAAALFEVFRGPTRCALHTQLFHMSPCVGACRARVCRVPVRAGRVSQESHGAVESARGMYDKLLQTVGKGLIDVVIRYGRA